MQAFSSFCFCKAKNLNKSYKYSYFMEEDRFDIDKRDMYSILERFPKQIASAMKLGENVKITEHIDRIIVTGMGGSALAGDILQTYLDDKKLPVYVNKDYFLPDFINSKSLVFVISYSGNTEETINAYRNALRKGAKIIVITSGGKLEMLARKQNIDYVLVPKELPPRLALGYLFFPMVVILQNSKLITDRTHEILRLIEILKKNIFKDKGKDLARKLDGKIPLIYTSERLRIIGYKWKINFNENTKIHAFCNVFPELDHNEINGFVSLKANYYVIIFKDENDYMKLRKQMDITKILIKKKNISVTEIALTGSSLLTKIFSSIYIGDWCSYFLALKYKIDPTPVKIIEELKRQL